MEGYVAASNRHSHISLARNNEDRKMAIFRVKVDYDHGKHIPDCPQPIVEVLAANAQEAAELACGVPLRRTGRAGQYRAQVWPLGGVRHAHEISHFYLL
jgi:hypothetical protein